MEVEDGSDNEGGPISGKQQGGSRDNNMNETAQEQAIDDNQMINEEYKIWLVTHNSNTCLITSLSTFSILSFVKRVPTCQIA
jgi:hypothetical protein